MQLQSLLHRLSIPRRAEASPRLVGLMLAARFLDEWGVGMLFVLLPVLRDTLGLSYAQVSLLLVSFGWADWVGDPLTGLACDVWPRRPILVGSALGTALVFFAFSGAESFGAAAFLLLLGICVAYSLTVTPSAVIADAVLVETHPDAPGRIMARQTLIDTIGALLAPLTVTLLAALGVAWPPAFLGAGVVWAGYALLLAGTRIPAQERLNGRGAPEAGDEAEPRGPRAMLANLRAVTRLPDVWRWQFFLSFGDFMTDVTLSFLPLFLADVIGLDTVGQGLVLTLNMLAGVAGLALLEPALARWGDRRVLGAAVIGVVVLFPLWLFSPSPALAVPILLGFTLCASAFYPVGKARLLAASEGYTATVTALTPIVALPTNVAPLIVGAVASAAGLRAGMALLLVAPLVMIGLLRAEAGRPKARRPEESVEAASV